MGPIKALINRRPIDEILLRIGGIDPVTGEKTAMSEFVTPRFHHSIFTKAPCKIPLVVLLNHIRDDFLGIGSPVCKFSDVSSSHYGRK